MKRFSFHALFFAAVPARSRRWNQNGKSSNPSKMWTIINSKYCLFTSYLLISIIKPKEVIKHPGYSPTAKKHDIALIRVNKRIWFSDHIKPACLHTDRNDLSSDVTLTVSGWGLVSIERKLKKILENIKSFDNYWL